MFSYRTAAQPSPTADRNPWKARTLLDSIKRFLSKVIKEFFVNIIGFFGLQAKFKCFKHIKQFFSIDKFYWRNTVAHCFFLCFRCECSSGKDYAFICSSHHCPPKISNL